MISLLTQKMIPRSELNAALAEVNISQAAANGLAREVETLKQQLLRTNEQCKAEQTFRSEMVPLSELVAARALEEAANASVLMANERQKEAGSRFEKQLAEKEEELDTLRSILQVLIRNPLLELLTHA